MRPFYQIQLWAGPNAKRMPAPAKKESAIGSELVVEFEMRSPVTAA